MSDKIEMSELAKKKLHLLMLEYVDSVDHVEDIEGEELTGSYMLYNL